MRQRSWKVWFYPEVAVTHKMSQSAKKNPENSIRYLYRGKLRFFCKHYGIRQGIFLKWLMFFSLYLHGSAVFAGTFFSKKGIKAGKTYFALAEIIKSSSLIENKDI
jgi:GT2 family glycosyltransferase